MANTVLGTLLIALKAETSAFSKGMNDAKRLAFDSSDAIVGSLGRIGQSLNKLNFDNLKNAGKSLGMLGGIAAGVGVAVAGAMVEMSRETAQNVKQMEKMAQSYGLTIQQVSAMRVASKMTGVEMDTLAMGMGRLAKAAAKVAESGQSPGGAFQAIGVRVTDAHGKLLPLPALMEEVAGKFSKMENGTTKTALAMEMFGRGGAQLIPFLNRGKEGIRELNDLSEKLGLTWDEKSAAAAEQLAHSVEILDLKTTALKEQMVRGLLPALDKLSDEFVKVSKDGNSLAGELGSDLGTGLVYAGNIIDSFIAQLKILAIDLREVKESITGTADLFGAMKNAALHPSQAGAIMREALERNKALQEQDDRDEQRINDAWKKRYEDSHKPWTAPKVDTAGDGGTNPAPALAAAATADYRKITSELDSLLNKTRELANQGEHDPFATQISNLKHLGQELETFRDTHTGIWSDVNAAIEKVNATISELTERQKAALNTILLESLKKQADAIGALPNAVPTAPGNVQAEAGILALNNEPNKRNERAVQLYDELRSSADRYRQTLKELDILVKHNNITQADANEVLKRKREELNASTDPQVRYTKALREYQELSKSTLLTEQSRVEMLRKLRELHAESDSKKGVGGGIKAGFESVGNEWKGMGTEAMQSTKQALGGMQGAMSKFFDSAAMGAQRLGKSFAELGSGMLASVVGALSQVLAKWTTTKAIMATLKLFGVKDDDPQANAKKQIAANVGVAQSYAGVAAAEEFAYALASSMGDIPLALGKAAIVLGIGEGFAGMASFAKGGSIFGAGTSTSDSIPIRASHGEYMVQADSVAKLGTSTMDAINNHPEQFVAAMKGKQKFATGGSVFRNIAASTFRAPSMPQMAFAGIGGIRPITSSARMPNGIGGSGGGNASARAGSGSAQALREGIRMPPVTFNINAIDGPSVTRVIKSAANQIGEIAVARVKRHVRTGGAF
jgi:hypothetical protein